ncbi:MAG: nucleotidyl transferase AbiEii/AbiGii toxin family protein [Bacteroidales bacterium]|jgi:predicted nucleotidyltransferase component of viral defense system
MIKPGEIQKHAAINKVKDGQIEKDYVITWILYGISRNKFLHENLIFKGGTVIKKAYFKDYRYSEDLDFTLKNDKIDNENLFSEFENLFEFVLEEANIPLKRNPETNFESGNVNFYIAYGGPLGGTFGKKDLKIDFTRNELLCFKEQDKSIFRVYSDLEKDFSIKCYQKQEVLIEKMRSLMERTQPRDIYDLWYLFEFGSLKIIDYSNEFKRKLSHKNFNHENLIDKINEKEHKFKGMWEKYLGNQIHNLPDFDGVYRELMKNLREVNFK